MSNNHDPAPPGSNPASDPASDPGLDQAFDLESYLHKQGQRVDQTLMEIIGNASQPVRIVEAMTYSLMAGGKRLRPILCIATADAVGSVDDNTIRAACALEMIHTYSLIHDDLPAMDNDDLRRGKPTCHIAFDESTAILTGDALLTLAFEVLATTGLSDPNHAVEWFNILLRISSAAGYKGMIEGQMRDIAAEGNRLTHKEIESMHALKTGSLIQASVYTGGTIGGGSAGQVERLCEYARHIGLAFQVADDILNVEGDPSVLGKAVGTDHAHEKSTYPSEMGLEKAKTFARTLVNNALLALAGFDHRAGPLRAIAVYVIERNR